METLKNGVLNNNIEHELGEAGWKVMTLFTKIKIELLLKNQSVSDLLTDLRISQSTFNKLKTDVPNERVYLSLAEYFGFDVDELKKLPIKRSDVIESIEDDESGETLEFGLKEIDREQSIYDVIEEAHYSSWFHGGGREQYLNEIVQKNNEIAERTKELKEQRRILVEDVNKQLESVEYRLVSSLRKTNAHEVDENPGVEETLAIDEVSNIDENEVNDLSNDELDDKEYQQTDNFYGYTENRW